MSKISKPPTRAVFLGAGASKAFGYPATIDILPAIRRGLDKDIFDVYDKSKKLRHRLKNYLKNFLPGWHQKNKITLPPITDLLSLLGHALLWNTAPIVGCASSELTEFRKLLERAIYEIIALEEDPTLLCKQFVSNL